jgi:IS4 transposase
VDRRQLIALRQSAEATRRAQQRLRRRAQQGQSTASAEALEFAAYFLVWTTLSAAFPAAAILDLYRLRWQIELVFKRMKSILGLGHLPKKDPLSAKAWLEGKLLTGLLIERMVRSAETFSPWGYALAGPTQQVARG